MNEPSLDDQAKHPPLADFASRYWRAQSIVTGQPAAITAADIGEDTFRLLADNIPTLCWIADGTGYIVWYNKRWHQYCGTTPEAMEGWGWQAVHHPETLPSVMESVSVVGFLIAYSLGGLPSGALRQVALVDCVAVPLLILVWIEVVRN